MPAQVSLEPIERIIDNRIDALKRTLKDPRWTIAKKLKIKTTIKRLEATRDKINSWCTPAAFTLRKMTKRDRDAAIWFIPGP